jgi:hypothetical protein
MGELRIRLEFSPARWEAARQQLRGHGGLMGRLAGGQAPSLYAPVEAELWVEGAQVATVRGEVLFASPDGDVALSLTPAEAARIEAPGVPGPVAPVAETGPAKAGAAETGPNTPGSKAARPEDAPVFKQYEAMTRPEKIHWAKYGNESQRRQVLRDRDASLHPLVLQNGQMTPREVAALMSTGSVSGQFVVALAERESLHRDTAIVLALVQHPLTPIHIAERLVARLPVETLRRIAKSTTLKTQIVAAARKRVST